MLRKTHEYTNRREAKGMKIVSSFTRCSEHKVLW